MNGTGIHGRDATDQAFYEWLLSDHPDARAKRDRRRAATYQAETGRAAAVRAWADKINAQRDAPQTLRDLAASLGPQADQTAARTEARYVEPDGTFVARLRTQHETHIQVSRWPTGWPPRPGQASRCASSSTPSPSSGSGTARTPPGRYKPWPGPRSCSAPTATPRWPKRSPSSPGCTGERWPPARRPGRLPEVAPRIPGPGPGHEPLTHRGQGRPRVMPRLLPAAGQPARLRADAEPVAFPQIEPRGRR